MAIAKMKKLRLLISRAEKESVLNDLMLIGCVEVSEPEPIGDDPVLSGLSRHENSELDEHRQKQQSLMRGLDILNAHVPKKTGLFAMKPEVTGGSLLDGGDLRECLTLAKTLDELDANLRGLSNEENNEKNRIESLTPWKDLRLSMDFEGTSTCEVVLGAIASSFDFDSFRNELTDAVAESDAFLVSSNEEQHYICAVYLKEGTAAAAEVLRRYSFTLTAHRTQSGTASALIDQSKQRLKDIETERAEITGKLKDADEWRDRLRLSYDRTAAKIATAEASDKLLGTQYSLMLDGWITASSEKEFLETVAKYDCAWELRDPTPEEYASVPVLLSNNPLTRPLSMVTEMYSLPAYGSIDPNPPMMPFFVLFYGLMMADMGYGLVMMIAAILVKRKKPRGGMRNFFDLLLLCGISTFIIGALTGGLFGDAPSQIAQLFGTTFTMYTPLFSPLDNTVEVLIGAFVLGFVHVIFGMAINFVKNIRDGHVVDAICDVASWWIVFAGIALGALGITWWVAIAGVAMIVLTGGRSKKNIFGKLIGGIGKLYDITAYFGDILSYSRIMALMLAGGVIAQVFNTLGVLTGNIVTFLIIFLAGHALNFGLNLLGCFVHDMRLQCLEFFGKFYEDGGKPFAPMRIKTKFNNVTSE